MQRVGRRTPQRDRITDVSPSRVVSSVDAAATRALDLALSRGPRCAGTTVVSVDGPSGSGKTLVAQTLERQIAERTGERCRLLHLDDLYPGWGGLEDGVGALARSVIEPLARDELAAYHRWDWHGRRFADWVPVMATPWLVIDGCGSGASVVSAHLSALVWVDADEGLRYDRAMAREDVGYQAQWERWAAQERVHFQTNGTRRRADVVVDTTPPTGPLTAH